MPKLHIFRGLPGSGKTTRAKKENCLMVNLVDDYCMIDGKYQWSEERQYNALEFWIPVLADIMMKEKFDIAIAEVFPRLISVCNLKEFAEEFGYTVEITDCKCTLQESIERNTHDVPIETLKQMHNSWQPWYID